MGLTDFIAVGVIASVATAMQPATQPGPDAQHEAPTGSSELAREIEASIARVSPLVARHLEVDAVPNVPVRTLTRAELGEAVYLDTLASLEGQLPPGVGLTEEQYADRVKQSVAATPLIAKYAMSDQALLVSPEWIEVLKDQARQAGLDPSLALDQVIAHELVHAVQDKRVGLLEVYRAGFTKALEQNRLETHFLCSAVVEGQATLVQLRIAQSIGGDELHRWADDRIPGDGPVLNQGARAYRYGLRFCESVERDEGMQGVWRRLANPPASITELVSVSGRRGDAIERAFDGFEAILGPGDWTPLRRDGLEQTLGAGLGLLSEEAKASIRDGLISASLVGRMELPTPKSPDARALVISILEYETDVQAKAAIEPLLELVRVQAMRFAFNPDGSRSTPEQKSLRLRDGQLAYYAKETMARGGSAAFGLLAWGGIENRLLIINGVGAPSAEIEAQPLLRLIAKRVDAIGDPGGVP
ncbi:MAG: hypothetical protein ACIARR_01480 [Phycisphaerales bacterium JB059]